MFENYNSAQKLAYSYLDRILEVYGGKKYAYLMVGKAEN